MKKVCSVIFGLYMLLMLPAVSLGADPGPYVSGQLGMTFLTDSDLSGGFDKIRMDFNPGYNICLAGGYDFGTFRVEGEIGYQQNNIDKVNVYGVDFKGEGDMTALFFLINGYYDFENTTKFTPYVAAGIGTASIDVNDLSYRRYRVGDGNDIVFAYQVGAGVGYAVSNNMTIDLKYRYFGTDDPNFEGVYGEYSTHNFYVGLRYKF